MPVPFQELLEKMFVARASIKMMQKQYNVAEPFFKKALDMTEVFSEYNPAHFSHLV